MKPNSYCAHFAILISITSINGHAQTTDPCVSQKNTFEIDQCATNTLKVKDKELNLAYQRLVKSLVADPKDNSTDYTEVKKRLVEAQRAWISYRDNDCKAKLKLAENGTMRGAIYLGCLTERTEQRTKELKVWSDG